MIELIALAQQCAPQVAPETMVAIARVESSFNPYAIGVVGGALRRQPRSKSEALQAVSELEKAGRNFSLGIVQVNRYNLAKYNLTYEKAFDTCANLRAGGGILHECYGRASEKMGQGQPALQAAFSCYYSGNFNRGFRPDKPGDPSYVQKVMSAALGGSPGTIRVPRISGVPQAATAAPQTRPVEHPVLLNQSGQPTGQANAAPDMRAVDVAEEPFRIVESAPMAQPSIKQEEGAPAPASSSVSKVVF